MYLKKSKEMFLMALARVFVFIVEGINFLKEGQ
jgi:hypothetical protein